MTKKAEICDLETVVSLAALLWSQHTATDWMEEFSEIMAQDNTQFFIQYDQNTPVGFAQCQLRYDYVEGTDTSPIGYLEGIFVREEYRRRGYARELLQACERWAKEKGCREFASDCEIGNDSSCAFHMAAGFTEANRIICFVKKL